MSISINKLSEKSSIKITKKSITETSKLLKDGDSIITPLYGKIKVVNNIDYNNFTYFDSIEGYDLFINNDGDNTVAMKTEDLNETNNEQSIDRIIETVIDEINRLYNVDKIEWMDSENAIVIKADKDTILKIKTVYVDNTVFNPIQITPNVLFLELKNKEIELDELEEDALDKLSDQDMKNVITKAGIKLSGTENKERLKGIMQGVISNAAK